MSIVICYYCSEQVDTDFEETYEAEIEGETVDVCQKCYDKDPPDVIDEYDHHRRGS